ncbi:MAG TPA: nucleoside triphosphate pyrophosphohydrolase [Sphingobacteriaceae bacterium]|nr:nucleoside triphosphate pyrophosphohydrolase [Sphingobacteriaceae bacterium]
MTGQTDGNGAHGNSAGDAFNRLVALVHFLRGPDGCPWDREQTHRSLRPYVLEEAYEVVEAIDALAAGDPDGGNKLQEELGDLLLHVVLHAEIASETGLFDVKGLIENLHEKLVRRHPHVFGTKEAASAADVGRLWEEMKARERAAQDGRAGGQAPGQESRLAGLNAALPALMRAYQVQVLAAKAGFDWQRPEEAVKKVWEEAREVRAAWRAGDAEALEAEVGDLLFALINVIRLMRIHPETALAGAVRRFEERFHHMEAAAAGAGNNLEEMSLDEMEELWQAAKAALDRGEKP